MSEAVDALSFEQAIAELEKVVGQLERRQPFARRRQIGPRRLGVVAGPPSLQLQPARLGLET